MLYSAMPLTALIPNELLGKFRKGSSPGSKSGILCPHATEAKHVPASWMIQKAECIMGVRAGPWVAGGSRKALLTVGACARPAELPVWRYGEAGEGLCEGAGPPQGANGRRGEAGFSTTRPQVSSR